MFTKHLALLLILAAPVALLRTARACALQRSGATAEPGPRRNHLTDQEADMVREAQVIDRRVAVFIKVADRRFLALSDPQAASSKEVQKDKEKWGELRTGTRAELLSDISLILDEAVTNIDDVASRDAKNAQLAKALRMLADASVRFIARLEPMRAQATDPAEREAIEQAMDNAHAVIEAASKLPPPPTKKS